VKTLTKAQALRVLRVASESNQQALRLLDENKKKSKLLKDQGIFIDKLMKELEDMAGRYSTKAEALLFCLNGYNKYMFEAEKLLKKDKTNKGFIKAINKFDADVTKRLKKAGLIPKKVVK
jgi:competence protein ComGF